MFSVVSVHRPLHMETPTPTLVPIHHTGTRKEMFKYIHLNLTLQPNPCSNLFAWTSPYCDTMPPPLPGPIGVLAGNRAVGLRLKGLLVHCIYVNFVRIFLILNFKYCTGSSFEFSQSRLDCVCSSQ